MAATYQQLEEYLKNHFIHKSNWLENVPVLSLNPFIPGTALESLAPNWINDYG